jgi:sugar/nucleoside kinase (ribokinase family)
MVCDVLVSPVTPYVFEKDSTHVENISMSTGGDALNQAVNLAKMGIDVGVAGKIGRDLYGDFILGAIQGIGVDTGQVLRSDSLGTAVSIVLVRPDAGRHFIVGLGAMDDFSLDDLGPDPIQHAGPSPIRALTIGSAGGLAGFPPVALGRLLQAARAHGVLTFVDTTGRLDGAYCKEAAAFLPYTDYFLPSFREACAMAGTSDPQGIIGHFLDMGTNHVIVKMGTDGVMCGTLHGDGTAAQPAGAKPPCAGQGSGSVAHMATAGSGVGSVSPPGAARLPQIFHVPATPDVAVDTTGAGDAFVAGFVAAALRGRSFKDSAVFGCKAAGLSVTQLGATTATTSFEEIDSRWPGHYSC